MVEAFGVALSHPNPTARLQAMYADYAWSKLGDRELATRMIQGAADTNPDEPTYRISLIQFLTAQGRFHEADMQLQRLTTMNIGGTLTHEISRLTTNLADARRARK
jgi:protein involved in temperature-dependent protein secretion